MLWGVKFEEMDTNEDDIKVKIEPKQDGSSGEEEQKAETAERGKRPKRVRQPPAAQEMTSGWMLVKSEGFPEIRSLSELARDNPHLCTDLSKADRCVGAGKVVKTEKAEEADIKTSTHENPMVKPLEMVELQRRLDAPPRVHPVIVDGQTWQHSDKVRLIRQNRWYLPLFTATFDSELLGASGTWKHTNGKVYNFPACIKGDRCTGMSGRIQFAAEGKNKGEPFKYVLTSLMFPKEYERFLKDGTAPSVRQLCVGCLRISICDSVAAFRGGQVMEGDKSTEITLSEDTLIQPCRNVPDCEDGYHREFMLEPSDEKYEGITGPIATFRATFLVGRKTKYNRPYVDQSALVWQPGTATSPALAESISDFSTGVSR